jgi:hypothetical protein
MAQDLTVRLGVCTGQGHSACIRDHFGPRCCRWAEKSPVAGAMDLWGLKVRCVRFQKWNENGKFGAKTCSPHTVLNETKRRLQERTSFSWPITTTQPRFRTYLHLYSRSKVSKPPTSGNPYQGWSHHPDLENILCWSLLIFLKIRTAALGWMTTIPGIIIVPRRSLQKRASRWEQKKFSENNVVYHPFLEIWGLFFNCILLF